MKVCNRCKAEKPEDQFGKNKNNPDGFDHYCKECRRDYKLEHKEQARAYKAKYRENHRDQINEKQRAKYTAHRVEPKTEEEKKAHRQQYYQDHKAEKIAYGKVYREKNKEHIKSLQQSWYQTHKSQVYATRKAWRDNNREAYRKIKRAAKHKRKAIIKGNGGSYTKAELDECLSYFDNRCAYTGEPLVEGYHMDHVTPLAKGGTSYIRNLVPCNPEPNENKSDQDLDAWYPKQPYYSKEMHDRIKAWIA